MSALRHELGNIKTLLFDVDGTLLDSHGYLMETQFRTLEKMYPGRYTYDQVERNFGKDFVILVKTVDDVHYQTAVEEFVSAKINDYHLNAKLFPGVLEGLKRLKGLGYKLGIVTNQNREAVVNLLRVTELDALFETVIALWGTTINKPAPDGLLKAIKELDAVPSESVMIGDSKADLKAAKNAEIPSVLLKWYGEQDMSACPPDLEYNNLDEFIEDLISVRSNRLV